MGNLPMQFQFIDERSQYLADVKQLWRTHSDTLGFFPQGAFEDYARERHIVVALVDLQCVGYLLYRITGDRICLAHFCVSVDARKQGVAKAMLNYLVESMKKREYRGIVLNCRRDFEASKTWPRLGFYAAGELVGRASNGSELIRWVLEFEHRHLFCETDQRAAVRLAIDSNIFIDLMERRSEETEGLKADWLRPLISLCYTSELLNEIYGSRDPATRAVRKGEVRQFELLQCGPEQFQQAEQALRPLFPSLESLRDESDFRHLVRALATGADAFVTRDEPILARAEEVFRTCGLPVLRPAEVIGRIDVIQHECDYQRNFVAGTRRIVQIRVHRLDESLVAQIQAVGEPRWKLAADINKYLSTPERSRCYTISDAEGAILAFFVVDRGIQVDRVPILRVCAKRRAATIARTILKWIVRQAATSDIKSVLIEEGGQPQIIQPACADVGFIPVGGGRLKIVLSGLQKIADIPSQLTWLDPNIEKLKASISYAQSDPITASQIEHTLWPVKLVDAELPCFIVPIRPDFAEQLFDNQLAEGGLFGADVDLALSLESAYYRSARSLIVSAPARVLWYVCKSKVYQGTMSIRACSRVIEVVVDKPKQLYSRFRRLGVYDWSHILGTARGSLAKDVMAFRFDDTELLPPVPWGKFQRILKSHRIRTTLQSPIAIPTAVFGEIYAAAFDSSKVCKPHIVRDQTGGTAPAETAR